MEAVNTQHIDNPFFETSFDLSWSDFKNHVSKVVEKFPNEYRIVKDEVNLICIHYFPVEVINQSGNDMLLFIRNLVVDDKRSFIRFEATNETNKISSYTEQRKLIKTIEDFKYWLTKSFAGTLDKPVTNNKPVDYGQVIIQAISLVVAIIAITYGLKACNM